MITLTQEDYKLALGTFPAQLRKRVRAGCIARGEWVQIPRDLGADMYWAITEYTDLRELDRDEALTTQGEKLYRIARSIFKQSGG